MEFGVETLSPGSTRSSHAQRIIAHRGLWVDSREQNSLKSLRSAVDAGFGVETDIRDIGGELCIRHDPEGSFVTFSDAWSFLSQCEGLLALNVKADGLTSLLATLDALPGSAFFFDASWPELLKYASAGFPIALRASEWEPLDLDVFSRLGVPARLVVDGFDLDWFIGDERVRDACFLGEVMLISPEIHGRDPRAAWDWVQDVIAADGAVSVCTDRCLDLLGVLNAG